MRSRTPLKPLLEFVRLLYAIAKTAFISSRIIASLDFISAVRYNYDSFHIYHFAHCFRSLPFQLPAFVDVFVRITELNMLSHKKISYRHSDEGSVSQSSNGGNVTLVKSLWCFGASIPRHILPFVTLSAY